MLNLYNLLKPFAGKNSYPVSGNANTLFLSIVKHLLTLQYDIVKVPSGQHLFIDLNVFISKI